MALGFSVFLIESNLNKLIQSMKKFANKRKKNKTNNIKSLEILEAGMKERMYEDMTAMLPLNNLLFL